MNKKYNMIFTMTRKGQAIKSNAGYFDGGATIKMGKGDSIVTAFLYDDEEIDSVLFITSLGFGARVKLSDIRAMGIGGDGVKFASITPKTGPVAIAFGSSSKDEDRSIRVLSTPKKRLKIQIKEIPFLTRGSQGVRLFKLVENDEIKKLS